jgi:flagellar biosynthesis protein FliR
VTELVVLSLRGAVAVAVLAMLAGGISRLVVIGLAVLFGLWSAMAVPPGVDASLLVAVREVVIGLTLGVAAAVPLLAASTAGRLVDAASHPRHGPYAALFGVLAAAVFVGIDGHVTFITAITDSHAAVPANAAIAILDAVGALLAVAVRLAIPWLVTAVVVELAVGAGMRLAARSAVFAPAAAAVPAALMMMTAALVATLAVAIAAAIRGLAT